MNRLIQAMAVLGVALLAVAVWMALTGPSPNGQTAQPASSSSPTPTPTSSSSTSTSSGWTVEPAPVGETPSPSSSSSSPSSSSPSKAAKESSKKAAKKAQAKKAAKSKKAKERAERGRAVTAARAFLTDLTDRDQNPKAWWTKVERHLTPQARTDMKGMEPDWIPPLKLKPGGGVVEASSDSPQEEHGEGLTTEVQVPTDSGWVTVMLHPEPGGKGYRVTRYRMPEGL